MSKIRHILRLHKQGRSKRLMAEQAGVSRNTLKKYLKEYDACGLSYEQLDELSDKDLEDLFVKPLEQQPTQPGDKVGELLALFPLIEKELKRKGMTRQLLWEEYKVSHIDGLGRSQFNTYYRQWKAQVHPTMHFDHKAGDKLYVDFTGEKLSITDRLTGEVKPVEVFVAILGASQLTYVEATMSQQKGDFIAACE